MKKDSITTNYVYNVLYQVTSLLCPFILTPYLIRVLGTEQLGVFSFTLANATIFFSVACLGINIYGQREVAYVQDNKNEISKVFFELFIIRFISTILFGIIYILFAFQNNEYRLYYLLFLPYILSNAFDISWLYQGLEKFKTVSVRTMGIRIIYLILVLALVRNKNQLWLYILLHSLQLSLMVLIFWIGLKKIIKKVTIRSLEFKKHLKNIFVFFIPQISLTIYTLLDKSMIGIFTPNIDNVYFYEQAVYIIRTVNYFIVTAGIVMMSRASYLFANNEFDQLRQIIKTMVIFIWLLASALIFGLCAVVDNFVPWFYGEASSMIIYLVYVLSPLILVMGLNNMAGMQILVPIMRQEKYTISVVCGAVLNFCLNIILIHLLGVVGAAISSVIAETTILAIEMYFARDILSVSDIIKPGFKYIIFGFIMFIVTKYVGSFMDKNVFSFLIQVVIGGSVYGLLLLISKDKFLFTYVIKYLKNMKTK